MVTVWLGLGCVMWLGVGCAGLPTGFGAASAGAPLEREAADHLLWAKRGQDFGLLARTYCIAGSPQERTWMRDVYNAISAPAKIMVMCPKWTED